MAIEFFKHCPKTFWQQPNFFIVVGSMATFDQMTKKIGANQKKLVAIFNCHSKWSKVLSSLGWWPKFGNRICLALPKKNCATTIFLSIVRSMANFDWTTKNFRATLEMFFKETKKIWLLIAVTKIWRSKIFNC